MKKFFLALLLAAVPICAHSQGVAVGGGGVKVQANQAGALLKQYASGTAIFNCSTGLTCTYNAGTGAIDMTAPTGGSGTVTSVGLSLPNIFAVSGTPVTAAGTLAASLASQSQNLVLASPSGGSGLPTFRQLLMVDLPAAVAQFTGAITAGDCAKWASSGVVEDAGAACASGGSFTAGGDLSGTSTSQTVIGLQGKALASPTTASTFPEYNGTSIVWAAGTGTTNPGGANTQVQFNNSSAFGGSSNFVWNNTTNTLTVTGTINATSFVSSGAGSAYTQWTTGSLSPGASGTVLCGANAGNVFACSDNGGPLANVAVAGNDLQVYSGNVMSVAGFALTSPGNMGTQPLTLQFNNDTTTGTVNDLLAKLGGVGASPSAIKIATTDTNIPVYPVTSATATSGAAILAVAGEAACTFDNATTYADYVVASTTTAGDCHDAGASLPTGPVYVVGTVAQAGGAAGNYLVKGPGFFIAAVPPSSPAVINGYCGGAVTASSFVYTFGMGGINAACASNDTVINTGYVMPYAGTIVAMYVHAALAPATNDVASVQINGSYPAPAITCTIAPAANACSVTGASAAFNAGDYIAVKIGTGASDTLGDISVSLEIQ